MKSVPRIVIGAVAVLLAFLTPAFAQDAPVVATEYGPVKGKLSADGKVRAFLGIPFAAPPVGPLRWKPPQPPAPWTAARDATGYGPHCMQSKFFKIEFQDPGESEDCLTLNVWAAKDAAKLPVMVWIYGGGFIDGGSSEARNSGESFARRGVVMVSMNYRLNVFGFFATRELAAESPQRAAGNYGLLDQSAAIHWVKRNIAAFGGDPDRITIFGESAGAFAVSAQMASPLTRDVLAGAIGESGGALGHSSIPFPDLATKIKEDEAFARNTLRADDLAALRAMSAADLAAAAAPKLFGFGKFTPNVDGWFLTESLPATFAAGKQARIPLMAGWNADEAFISAAQFPGFGPPNLGAMLLQKFGLRSLEAARFFPAANNEQAVRSADELNALDFLVYGTWAWLEAHAKTGGAPVYRYYFNLPPPPEPGKGPSRAYHSDEMEYVFGTMDTRKGTRWRPEDYALSEKMHAYWINFAKTGDPNAPGLPAWPKYGPADKWQVMYLDPAAAPRADDQRERFLFLQKVWTE